MLGWATAVLLQRRSAATTDALAAAQRACEHDDAGHVRLGAGRAGRGRRAQRTSASAAATALERLRERTQASGTDWALGIEARSRALLTTASRRAPLPRGDRAARPAAAARVHLARAQLLLRRVAAPRAPARRRPRAAAHRPRDASAASAPRRSPSARAASCSPPARRARKRTAETRDELTPQEAQIARLARDGLTNPEIGARLFISPRTVEYHLHKVFRKLDISTRKELPRALAEDAAPA